MFQTTPCPIILEFRCPGAPGSLITFWRDIELAMAVQDKHAEALITSSMDNVKAFRVEDQYGFKITMGLPMYSVSILTSIEHGHTVDKINKKLHQEADGSEPVGFGRG